MEITTGLTDENKRIILTDEDKRKRNIIYQLKYLSKPENLEKSKARQRDYYQRNKEKYKSNVTRRRDQLKQQGLTEEKIVCGCGSVFNKSHLPVHKRTKQHKRYLEKNEG